MATVEYLYLGIFVITLIIIALKDKKMRTISKPVIFFGAVVGGAYIIYLYITKKVEIFSIYKYVIYFAVICALFAITKKHKKYKYNYLLEIMMLCIYMNMFVISEVFLITAVITMVSLTISLIIKKKKNKIDKSDILAEDIDNIQIPIGTYVCISNMIAMIISSIEFIRV